MDMTVGELIRFNEFLDSSIDQTQLDEEFIASRLAELDGLAKKSDGTTIHILALSYAKLLELTVLLAGKFADNCQMVDFGDLVVNPRRVDVCILNAGLIAEEFGVADSLPLWFKKKVHARIGSRYAEDLGRMVVDPSLLLPFVEEKLLLGIVKKERRVRLSDQFRGFLFGDAQSAFSSCIEEDKPVAQDSGKGLGCGNGRGECPEIAAWLADNTVLNVVKDSVKNDLMSVLRDALSDDYLTATNKKFEKAFNALSYLNIGRKNSVDFPYGEDVSIADWDEINQTLCHFTLDGYYMIQSELDKSLSNSTYQSPLLNKLAYDSSMSQHTEIPNHCGLFQHHLTYLKQSLRTKASIRLQ
ncbi:hypothetical protein [uncultured Pseudodesulfovibrio sp.]|uniref:hypothetical protein n=1 Tax=uncultured Pseudodesulfovibrio sp. TaxID=2035858 RepID=UPI0029C64214|nr:hypothetical protein [uncultured Pseudodesulfovibrio sp.]